MKKVALVINFILVAFLSLTAALPKIVRMEHEVSYFEAAGLPPVLLVVLGIVQLVGGVLLPPKKTRPLGGIIAAIAFGISALCIFAAGDIAFGLFSLIPVAMAVIVAKTSS